MMKNSGYGIFFLRLFIGARLIYGVIDNVISWSKMLEFKAFLAANNFPVPLACAVISVYAQLIAGIMIILGWRIRLAAFVMIFNFIIAASLHIYSGHSVEVMTPALAILFSCLLFFLEGPGKLSLKAGSR